MGKKTTGSKLKAGMTYRKLGPFGNEPSSWVKAARVQPAVARGYLVVTIEGEGYATQTSLRTTDPIEIATTTPQKD